MMFNSPFSPSFLDSPLPKPPSHQVLARILESDSRLSAWIARHRAEVALTQSLRRHLPRPIADRMRVADIGNGVLEIAATAGAIAATLRQRAPELRIQLARDGWDFTEIRVRVQVAGRTSPEQKMAKRQWDSASASPLFDLAAKLPEGPLKEALARWSRRARGR